MRARGYEWRAAKQLEVEDHERAGRTKKALRCMAEIIADARAEWNETERAIDLADEVLG